MYTHQKWLLPLSALLVVTACSETAGTPASPLTSAIAPASQPVPVDMATRSVLQGPLGGSKSNHSRMVAPASARNVLSSSAITVFDGRAEFENRHVAQTEDFAQFAGMADYIGDPYTSKGVTYTTGHNIAVGADIGFGAVPSPVVCYDQFTPMRGLIGSESEHYSLFGFDLTLLALQGEVAPVTITLTTNRGSYVYPNVTAGMSPEATFFGFAAEADGEYFTGFVIDADRADNAACLKNVSVGSARPQDATAPVIVPTVTGTKGANDWYTSAAALSWSVTDAESAVSSRTGCDELSVWANQEETTYTCTATSMGGTASASTTIKVDRTIPTVTGAVTSGTLGTEGWYTSNVGVTWTTTVPGPSGIMRGESCAESTLASNTASHTFRCVVKTGAGIPSAPATLTVKRDGSPPLVSYSGNAGSYSVADRVDITCSATDSLSGVASTTCANIAGDAFNFAVGANSFSASAIDHAGNVSAPASTSFTLTVTAAGVCTLVERWTDNSGTANSLCGKLSRGDYAGFTSGLDTQSGKKITAEHVAILKRLVSGM